MTPEVAPCAWHKAASVAMNMLTHTSERLSWQWHFGGEDNEQPLPLWPEEMGGGRISLK